MHKILIVDDEPSTRETMSFYFEKEGHVPLLAENGEQALSMLERENPDLIILDVMLPGKNGFEVCVEIRRINPTIPVMFVTAKGDIVDKGIGFKIGADDYITKPFIPDELIMRANSCLRRQSATIVDFSGGKTLVFNDLEITISKREIKVRGETVKLTTKEFDLLVHMASYPNVVFTKQKLLCGVWSDDYIGDQGVVAVYIRRLREKIEEFPESPKHLLTDWGVGYRFVP